MELERQENILIIGHQASAKLLSPSFESASDPDPVPGYSAMLVSLLCRKMNCVSLKL